MENADINNLIKNEITFYTVLKCVTEGVIILDNYLNICAINNNAMNILKIADSEAAGKNIDSVLKDDNLKSKIHSFLNCISHGNDTIVANEEVTFSAKGLKVRCILNISPITKSGSIDGFVITINKLQSSSSGYKASYTFKDIITENPSMFKIMSYAKKAAATDCSILLEGNSGTGKEVFAQAIHNHSNRRNGPFIAVNCSAIPRELMESELFGYEKGAFTGASKNGAPGKFELADGGTLFLDEIGELPLDLQSKLLRVLDNYKVSRIGSSYEKPVDIRVISATNRVLAEEVNNKNFRLDLYYRLNVIGIHLMQLKDRKEDIEAFADYFIYKLNLKNQQTPKRATDAYIEKLKQYDWPGNIRELRNAVERSYYLCEGNKITETYLSNNLVSKTNSKETEGLFNDVMPIKEVEKVCINNALKKTKGNVDKAAELLGISRATIYRRLK